MRKFALFLLVCAFISIQAVNAQVRQVSGTVTSADDGSTIPGVSVFVKGTSIGTITNSDGFYQFNVPQNAETLVFTYVGLITQEKPITGSTVNASMEADVVGVDEVIVIAYGTTKKSSFTGAATQVGGEKLQKQQVSNISKALEGTVAGVQTSSASGTPGSSANIIIRGIGSISASQNPLIVVDGVPYEGSLNSIATQDIESMTVLKDAAANSMYGARGANGVIIITTKGNKAGKVKINADLRYGFNARGIPNYDIITDHGDYYEMMFESIRNNLVDELGYWGASVYAAENLISGYLKYNSFSGVADNQLIDPVTGKINPAATSKKWKDDWTKDPFNNGARQEYNINISGGTDETRAYASLSYLSDEGYVTNSGFDRISARVKVDQKIGDYVKVGGNIAYANTVQKVFGTEGSNYANIFMFTQQIAPIYPIYLYDNSGNPVYDDSGNRRYDYGTEYARPYASEQNPYATIKDGINKSVIDNLSSRGYVEINFLKDFKFTANIAYDVFNTNQTNYATPNGGDAANVNGRSYKYATRYGALNANQMLSWVRSFNDHSLDILFVHETKNDKYNYMYGHMTNFVNADNPDFNNATLYQDLTSYTSEYSMEGYLGRLEYNYADKYYVTASFRRDASSRFHPDVRWGTFWAVGASWRINEEAFLRDVTAINALKLKASYGTQGNDNIGRVKAYLDFYSIDRVDGEAGMTKVIRGNKDLTWEKSANFNVGFELGLLNRINVNADFFIKETTDMLYASPLAPSQGNPTSIYRNEMDMKNTGFEMDVNAYIIKRNDISWNVAFNLMHYKNKLTRLPVSKPASEFPDGYQAGNYWRKLGGSLYDWYTYEYAGVDPETGAPQYNHYDSETGEVTLANITSESTLRQTGKSAIPDLTGGISTTLEIYGFDLSIGTAFQLGGWTMDYNYAGLMNTGANGENMHKDMFKRWTPTHTDTDIPKLVYENQETNQLCDRFLTNSSYFSLRNVTVGYSLPSSVIKKLGAEKLRIYLTGDNIWFSSKRKGMDPRYSFTGYNNIMSYSALSTYSVGISLTF